MRSKSSPSAMLVGVVTVVTTAAVVMSHISETSAFMIPTTRIGQHQLAMPATTTPTITRLNEKKEPSSSAGSNSNKGGGDKDDDDDDNFYFGKGNFMDPIEFSGTIYGNDAYASVEKSFKKIEDSLLQQNQEFECEENSASNKSKKKKSKNGNTGSSESKSQPFFVVSDEEPNKDALQQQQQPRDMANANQQEKNKNDEHQFWLSSDEEGLLEPPPSSSIMDDGIYGDASPQMLNPDDNYGSLLPPQQQPPFGAYPPHDEFLEPPPFGHPQDYLGYPPDGFLPPPPPPPLQPSWFVDVNRFGGGNVPPPPSSSSKSDSTATPSSSSSAAAEEGAEEEGRSVGSGSTAHYSVKNIGKMKKNMKKVVPKNEVGEVMIQDEQQLSVTMSSEGSISRRRRHVQYLEYVTSLYVIWSALIADNGAIEGHVIRFMTVIPLTMLLLVGYYGSGSTTTAASSSALDQQQPEDDTSTFIQYYKNKSIMYEGDDDNDGGDDDDSNGGGNVGDISNTMNNRLSENVAGGNSNNYTLAVSYSIMASLLYGALPQPISASLVSIGLFMAVLNLLGD